MPNAKDASTPTKHNILLVGPTGSGKTSQIWTLPGKKFAYLFDPNALASLRGCDLDYQEFLPDILEMDSTLKGFNKGSRSDQPASRREPTTYLDWGNDLNEKSQSGFFDSYDWLIIDSLTFLQKAAFDRNAWINDRYGKIEELSDYRVVGSKLSDITRSICSLPINVYLTGHIREFQDEVSRKISTEANLAGSARTNVPLVMTNIWLAGVGEADEGRAQYTVQTQPAKRGLQTIRSTIKGLEPIEDVTILDFNRAEDFGIGALLNRHKGD
jgi:hypothetical protein